MIRRASSLLACAVLLAACAATPRRPPAPIVHVVTFRLFDGARAEALIDDCTERLGAIPSVTWLAAGRHLDIGREGVVSDDDVALLVGYEDVAGYEAYLEHPEHQALVAAWAPRLADLTVRDVSLATERTGEPRRR